MHLVEPQPALDEMARVSRPGGRVGVVDFDQTLLIDPMTSPPPTRWCAASPMTRDIRIGRKLRRMFVEAGPGPPVVQ